MEVRGQYQTLAAFTSEKEPPYPLNRRIGEPQKQSGVFEQEKNRLSYVRAEFGVNCRTTELRGIFDIRQMFEVQFVPDRKLAISKGSWLLLFRDMTVVRSENYTKCSVRGICR